MGRFFIAFVLLSFGLASHAFSQQNAVPPQRPELPPRLRVHWDRAEKAVIEARKTYLKANQKALDDFAKQANRVDPQCDVKELCEQFKAVVMDDTPEIAVPVFGPGILVGPNNHKYKLFDDNLAWGDAKKKCEEEGGHLLVIDSQEEFNFIRTSLQPKLQPGNDQIWMGATKDDKGAWVWVTGLPMANTGWEAHFPVPDGGKDFLVMNGNGAFINERGNNRPGMRFICEWER